MNDHILDDFVVTKSASIRDAMIALERGARSIVLMVDGELKLIGLATDGDLRRALLGGATIDSPLFPHVRANYSSVAPTVGRNEVIDLMQARRIAQVPVVDEAGRLVGLHLLHDVIGAQRRANWAVIMAGGRGSRLSPLTERIPKPMIRVAGRPILERIVLHLVSSGIRRIFLSINYLGSIVEEYFGDGTRLGCSIEYVRETEPLGTGGSLSLLPPVTHPLLVMNGDLVTQANIGGMLDHHHLHSPSATVAVRRYFHTVPFGCVEIENERVVRFEEKPRLSRLVNAGIYVLSPALLERIPQAREFPITDLIEDCLSKNNVVSAFEIEDDWIDVGQREQLRAAREGETP